DAELVRQLPPPQALLRTHRGALPGLPRVGRLRHLRQQAGRDGARRHRLRVLKSLLNDRTVWYASCPALFVRSGGRRMATRRRTRKPPDRPPQPPPYRPMAATLVDAPFDHPDWVFEPKLDGEVVCFDAEGRTSFRALQQRFRVGIGALLVGDYEG